MQYVHCLRSRPIHKVARFVDNFCDNIVYHYQTSVGYIFFCKCNARNPARNLYERMSSILFLKSSIPFWHLPYSSPKFLFHSIFHTMPWLLTNDITRKQKATRNLRSTVQCNDQMVLVILAARVGLLVLWREGTDHDLHVQMLPSPRFFVR